MYTVCGAQIGQEAFRGTKTLNRIQSIVFEAAYTSNENLLICAPTGAGKTNVAMLTVLHELKQHLSQGVIKKDEFKVSAPTCTCSDISSRVPELKRMHSIKKLCLDRVRGADEGAGGGDGA